MSKTYSELLRDPRWEEVRLKVLKRDRYKCKKCGTNKRILQVHHTKYKGQFPWDTPIQFLKTLCDSCHFKGHRDKILAKQPKVKPTAIEIGRIKAINEMQKSSNPYLKMFGHIVDKCQWGKYFEFSLHDKVMGDYIRKHPHGITAAKMILIEDRCIEIAKPDTNIYKLHECYINIKKDKEAQEQVDKNIIKYARIHQRVK